MTPPRELPLWRSLLYVPATSERFVDRAHERGADAVTLDLEDSIPAGEKAAARHAVERAIDRLAGLGCPVLVRVNNDVGLADDLRAAIRPGVVALELPKVTDAAQLAALVEQVEEREAAAGLAPGAVRLSLLVESAGALLALPAIAALVGATPRIVALTLGNEDLAAELGIEPTALNLFHPCQQIVLAARAAGVLPLGYPGSVADYRDLGALRASVRRARAMGFVGSSCIHPSHVPILNAAFTPTGAELEHARRVVAAAAEAARAGLGAFDLDGRMVDAPIVSRAERICTLADGV